MKPSVIIILIFYSLYGHTDDLIKSIEVASQGAKIQAERLKLVAQNLANQDTLGIEAGSDPYKRRLMFVQNQYDRKLKTHIVKIKKFGESNRFIKKYDPYHPAADSEGIVKTPDIDPNIERVDSTEAKNEYEANLAVIELSKGMLMKTIEIMK